MKRLPRLPDEVICLIWEYVRSDLRPRLNRSGRLLSQIRERAAARIAETYAPWLYRYISIPLVVPIDMVLSVWDLFDLRVGLSVWTEEDGRDASVLTLPTRDGSVRLTVVDDLRGEAPTVAIYRPRVTRLWRCVPPPRIIFCANPGCRRLHLHVGRPRRAA